jgi:hypothetical protein
MPLNKDPGPEDVVLDVYIPYDEINRNRSSLERPISRMAQIFAQSIAIPHLSRLLNHCKVANISPIFAKNVPPKPADSKTALRLIPPPVEEGSPHFRFLSRPPGALETFLVSLLHDPEYDTDDSMDWRHGGEASLIHDAASTLLLADTTDVGATKGTHPPPPPPRILGHISPQSSPERTRTDEGRLDLTQGTQNVIEGYDGGRRPASTGRSLRRRGDADSPSSTKSQPLPTSCILKPQLDGHQPQFDPRLALSMTSCWHHVPLAKHHAALGHWIPASND